MYPESQGNSYISNIDELTFIIYNAFLEWYIVLLVYLFNYLLKINKRIIDGSSINII